MAVEPVTQTQRAETGPRRRHRIALMLVLIAAAMPVRVLSTGSAIGSLSVLDILLFGVAATLVLDCALRPLDIGYRTLFVLLCIPAIICAASMLWSQDRGQTLRTTLIYAEGIIAYLFVLRELAGASPTGIVTYIKRYTYLLIIPAVLLLLHTPGFSPQEKNLDPDSTRYLSYYTRLSHPVLGPSNNLATVLAFFVPVLLYWGHVHRDRRFTRAGCIALVAVVLTLSRGVLLALLITALFAALGNVLRKRRIDSRTAGKACLVGASLMVGVTLLYELNQATHEFIGSRFNPHTAVLRLNFAIAAFGKIGERPFLGFGGGVAPDRDGDLARVHDTYIQQFVNFGVLLGLVVSLTLIGTALFFFSRWRTSGVARAVGFALMAQLIIFAVESSYEGVVLRVLFYLSVGLVTALVRASESPPSADEGSAAPSLAVSPTASRARAGTSPMRHEIDLHHELIICTKDRPIETGTCLDSVAEQSSVPDRVIVVDSSRTDTTRRMVESVAQRTGLAVEFVHCAPGLTRQRNVALDHVDESADIVHFVDDDAVLDPECLREILSVFDDHPEAGGVGGRISNLWDHEPPWYRRAFLLSSRRQGVLLSSGANVLNFTGERPRRSDWLSGCSMSYRSESIAGMRFDEGRAGNGVGEDVDFSARVAQRAVLMWAPRALLEHRQSPVNREDVGLVQRRTIRSRWRLAHEHVGPVRPFAVCFGIAGEVLIDLALAARLSSRSYLRLAVASAAGAVDIIRKIPV